MNKTNLSASYDVDLAQKVGVIAAALFNKIVYLSRYTDREDGFCWRTAEEFERELGITRKQQESAIKKLEDVGLVKTKNTYIKGTQVKCKHFLVLSDCAKRGNQISTKGRNQNSTKGINQISTKGEDLYLKENYSEYENSNSHTQNKGVCVDETVMNLIKDFAKEKGNSKTEELLLSWMEIRRAKKAVDTEGTVKANLEAIPAMARESNMGINEYLAFIIRKGWKDLYPRGEDRSRYPRMKTGAEAGIVYEPPTPQESSDEDDGDRGESDIPDDILDLFRGDDE